MDVVVVEAHGKGKAGCNVASEEREQFDTSAG